MSENLTQDPVTTDGGTDVDADAVPTAPESHDDVPESPDTVPSDTVPSDIVDSDSPVSEGAQADPAAGAPTELAGPEDADKDHDSHADAGGEESDTEVTENADVEDSETEDGGSRPAPTSRRGQLEREGEVAADFLESLLDICDLDGDIDVDIDGDRAAVSIVDSEDGRVPRRLIGQGGQVLDALQELTRLAVQSATGERSRLMLDVGGHRAERRATLVTLATEAIEEVRSTGERKPLTPMTAFERKVVHDEVLAAGLVSESEGSEPRRYVVIIPV